MISRKTPQLNQTITLPIHGIGSSGEGVGYYQGYTVFVDGALPGETVEARLVQCQKNYGKAELVTLVKPSSDRVEPPCPLFGKCGGCQLMHLSYPKQLEMKRQRVVDALRRIGKMKEVRVDPCLPSPASFAYRNKIQLPVRQGSQGLSLGLYARSSHDLVEVETCHIHCALGEQIYHEMQAILKEAKIRAYNPVTGEGELRHLLIKSAVRTEEALVILVTNGESTPLLSQIASEVMKRCPAVKGVVHNKQVGRDNIILGNDYQVLAGVGSITERLCDMTFKVSPASFFQVNPDQAEQLYLKALALTELKGDETVLDTYCGVGTLSLIFAKQAKHVIGVESVPAAICDAQENAALNHIHNVTFICEAAESYVGKLVSADVVLLNPPRKGCEPSFIEGLGQLLPKKILYISCDPATLARDLAHLHTFGYKIAVVQPVDMFPQTAHVESIVLLLKDPVS